MQRISKALEIEGWMTRPELEWLQRTAKRIAAICFRPRVAEIGSHCGRSTVALAVPGVDLVCVDTFQGTPGVNAEAFPDRDIYAEFVANMNRLGIEPVVMRMDAERAAAAFPQRYFQMAFLDCDKSAFPRQFGAWYPKIEAGGLYCGHDHSPEFPLVQQTLTAWNVDYDVALGTSIWWFHRPTVK